MKFLIYPKKFLQVQCLIVAALVSLSLLAHYFDFLDREIVSRLSLNSELSIATWYSSLLLLICAVLLGIISSIKYKGQPSRYSRHWKILALTFMGLSIDESISLHEMLIDPLKNALNAGGFFYYTWVVVAIPLVALFVVLNLRFLAHLPEKIRRLFWFSGAVYVAGAIGCEMIGGFFADLYNGPTNMPYVIVMHLEETLEMAGVSFFIYTLLTYLGLFSSKVRFDVSTVDRVPRRVVKLPLFR